MRLLQFIISFTLTIPPLSSAAEAAKAGIWDFTEIADGESTSWAYEILSSGGMIVGVGHPAPDLGDFSLDGELDFTTSFVFLNKKDDASYSGIFLEADGKGKQISFGITGELADNGESLTFIARNQLGDEISRASGKILHESPERKFQPGKWIVREIVAPQKGGWDIYWDFALKGNEKGITGTGRKMAVNEKDATPGEKKTISKISLDLPDEKGRLSGTGVETNATGKTIKAQYQGWIAPSGDWFVLQSYENDRAISVIHGTWDE